ncbi:MAG: Gfo/Idh/MocA family oxidoreductase [Leptospirales bacterium]|nr:Gfo/Idh/MocA family oxidoreductase [Leptospirales bacterium]
MDSKLPGICFIGCGKIAEKHSKILRNLYKKIPLYFFDLDYKRALDLKSKTKGMGALPSLQHAFDSDDVDIIFITTPHAYHSEIACEAANNGKHIIIEKPVTRTLKELKNIIFAVEKNQVRCTVAENYFYKSFTNKIKNLIEEEYIGQPLFIEINKYNKDKITGWRTDKELMGGGALLEGGVHWINFLVSLSGSEPKSVIALKPNIEYETNIPFEDSLNLMVKFNNGICAKLFHSWRIPNRFKGLSLSKIYGTDGVITFESNGLFISAFGKKKKKYFADISDFLGYKKMLSSFVDNFVRDKPWEPNLDRIETELKLVHAAYKSLKSNRFEDV